MTAFGSYSRYYDLLYGGKDYATESRYVIDLLKEYAPDAKEILELGCGTGGHAAELAAAGYEVFGVDVSEGMLERANAKRGSMPADVAKRVGFAHGDLRNTRLSRRFDAVVSLFHVISYQTTNADLRAAFETAREHINDGGIFLFDCWYGPGVLTDRPQTREKHVEDSTLSLRRLAEPVMYPGENVVQVNYTLEAKEKAHGATETVRESHRMRYLFTPEIELLLEQTGMNLIASRGWMSEREPDLDSWTACFIAEG